MDVMVALLFGTSANAVGWLLEREVDDLPPIGMAAFIRYNSDEDDMIQGQIYRAWEPEPESDEPLGGILIYGGPTIPSKELSDSLMESNWEPLAQETLHILAEAIEETPPIAAEHEVVLVSGDVAAPETIKAFRRIISPADPALPIFSQRMWIVVPHDCYDEETEEDAEIGAVDLLNDDDIDRALRGLETDWESRSELPGLVLMSNMKEPGIAQIFFWTPPLSKALHDQLLEHEWEEFLDFDPEEFRLEERHSLAMRTRLTVQESEYGTITVSGWNIDGPEEIPAEQYDLLPLLLVEHCKAEIEFSNIGELIKEWSKEK